MATNRLWSVSGEGSTSTRLVPLRVNQANLTGGGFDTAVHEIST